MSIQRIKLPILGMTCAACVYRIEQALTTTEGVTDVYVSRTPAYASLRYDPTQINLAALIKHIYHAGYAVQQMTLELSIVGAIADSGVMLEEVIGKQVGVLSVHVNAATQKAQITYIPGLVHRSDIVKAVESVGYNILDDSVTSEGVIASDLEHKGRLSALGMLFLKLSNKFLTGPRRWRG